MSKVRDRESVKGEFDFLSLLLCAQCSLLLSHNVITKMFQQPPFLSNWVTRHIRVRAW